MVNVNFPRGHRKSWLNMNLSDPYAQRKYGFCDQRREPMYESEDEDAYKMAMPPNLAKPLAKSNLSANAVVLNSHCQCEVTLKNLLHLTVDQLINS